MSGKEEDKEVGEGRKGGRQEGREGGIRVGVGEYIPPCSLLGESESSFAMTSKKDSEMLFAIFYSPTNVLVNPLGLEFQPVAKIIFL